MDSNSKWQLAQRLDGEKKKLGRGGGSDRFEPPELTGELRGGELVHSAERHSLVCFQTLMRFWQEKRSNPPSPAAIPLMLGHLWAHGVDSSSHRITMLPYSKQTSIWHWWWFFFSLFLRKFNEVGPLMADELSFYCLFNIQNQTLIFLDLVHWQINALVFLGQWRIFSSSQERKKRAKEIWITLHHFLWAAFAKPVFPVLLQQDSDRKRDSYIGVFVVCVHMWCGNQIFSPCNKMACWGTKMDVLLKVRQMKNDCILHNLNDMRFWRKTVDIAVTLAMEGSL